MAGRKAAIASLEPRLGGIRVQTSLYGQTIPVVYGRAKLPVNLVWYGGFKAVRQEEQSETSKGGSSRPTRQYYTYSASVVMLLAEGPIAQVRTAWKGKQKFDGTTTAATTATATYATGVPGTPYQVGPLSNWTGNVAVVMPSADPLSYPSYDTPLVEGVDYTVSGGTYTFAPSRTGASVVITYLTSTASASVDALGQLGLVLAPGTAQQPVWQYLTSAFPAEALPYAGFAYLRGQDYPLTSAAEVENHNVEVDGFLGYYASGDARPRDVIADVLTNPRYSASQWPSAYLGDWSVYGAYCEAYSLKISPACLEQRPTRDWLSDILDATNTDASWNGATLRLIPRGDENAGSYVAPVTPVFDLGPDDFLASAGEAAVRLRRVDQQLVPNVVRIEYAARDNGYEYSVVTAEDEVSQSTWGRIDQAPLAWHFLCDATAAQVAANLRLQRQQAIRAEWEFRLPWRFAELEPGDIVTLTDAPLSLTKWPVKVKSIEEEGDDFSVLAEDYPIGHATAPIVAPQLGSGFRPDFNVSPGAVATPQFIEPPGGYTANGLEVWAAVSGQSGSTGQYWGGAEVYASLDGGTSYKLVGRVEQGARYGTLSSSLAAGAGAPLSVTLAGRGGQLRSVSENEADALTTLAFVGSPATGEFLAFQNATLTGTNAYTLTGLRRGKYGTVDQAADNGTPWVYVDGAVAMSGPLPSDMVGKTIYFKFCSFNVFGGGLQALADVTPYSYVVTGRFREVQAVTSANLLTNASFEFSTERWNTYSASGITSDLLKEQYYAFGAVPANARLQIQSLATGTGNVLSAFSELVVIDPNQLYAAYVDALPLSVDCAVGVAWYDAAGNYLSASSGTILAGRGAGTENPKLIERYDRSWVYATAPAAARYARLAVYATGTWTASDSFGRKYVYCYRPFLGQVPAGVNRTRENLPPWDAGTSPVVGTAGLQANAATDTVTLVDSTGATVAAIPWVLSKTLYAEMLLIGPTIVAPTDAKMEVRVTFTVGATYAADTTARNVTAMLFRNRSDATPDYVSMPVTRASGSTETLINCSISHTFIVAAGESLTPMLGLNRTSTSSSAVAEKTAPGIATSNNTTDRVYGAVWNVVLIKR